MAMESGEHSSRICITAVICFNEASECVSTYSIRICTSSSEQRPNIFTVLIIFCSLVS